MNKFLADTATRLGAAQAIQSRDEIITQAVDKFNVSPEIAGVALAGAITALLQAEKNTTITDKIIADRIAGRRRRIDI